MRYPLQLTSFDTGLALYIPVPEMVKSGYKTAVEADAATAFPFWTKIWDSATVLTRLLLNDPGLVEGKKILELGAGIGLPSFAIAKMASSVLISDADPDAVDLIRYNIESLQLTNTQAACIDWNDFPDAIDADVVLLSDINYSPEQFSPLLKLIKQFIDKGSVVILTTPQRLTSTLFIEELEKLLPERTLQVIQDNSPESASVVLVLKKPD